MSGPAQFKLRTPQAISRFPGSEISGKLARAPASSLQRPRPAGRSRPTHVQPRGFGGRSSST
eukprot:15319886-Alexandrium_andersonii.AAC.1